MDYGHRHGDWDALDAAAHNAALSLKYFIHELRGILAKLEAAYANH
jgi:hypothetical protein